MIMSVIGGVLFNEDYTGFVVVDSIKSIQIVDAPVKDKVVIYLSNIIV